MCVARNAEIVIAEIGKQGRLAIAPTAARMACRAIAFVRTVEQRETAELRGIKPKTTSQKLVVFGIERTKIRIELFVLRERE